MNFLIPDKKLTDNLSNNSPNSSNGLSDNEIVKALYSMYRATVYKDTITMSKETAIGLYEYFNRQKAEIKEWKRVVETWVEQHEKDKAEIERLKAEVKFSDYLEYETTNKIKSEAYNEFAERLKEKAKANEWNGTICGVDIDNLLKELVGEDDG